MKKIKTTSLKGIIYVILVNIFEANIYFVFNLTLKNKGMWFFCLWLTKTI